MAPKPILRANSPLRRTLGAGAVNFLEHAAGSIERILPHVKVVDWREAEWAKAASVWASASRTEIRVTFAIGRPGDKNSKSLSGIVRRRSLPLQGGAARSTLDDREFDICNQIVRRLSQVMESNPGAVGEATIKAIRAAFDEYVVAQHIEAHYELPPLTIDSIFDALHTLSEQSYENKALTFGCIVDSRRRSIGNRADFPEAFLTSKKYKALSDGFRTAYLISGNGKILDFVDIDRFEKSHLTERHHYPDWAEPIARVSREGRCGIALSRQGDILVFDNGTLRFTYRFGRWQYWNHAHLVHLLRDLARAQHVRPSILGRVVGAIYRAALDVSFRRSGGLFVVLRNRTNLARVVRFGEAIGDDGRDERDLELDEIMGRHPIQSLPRAVAVEIAALDGAVVFANSGQTLAYGAVLQPKKVGRLRGTEGSRTKAAIGASNYGLAIKVSSDGDITIYSRGIPFMTM
jgi:hypothetical protein